MKQISLGRLGPILYSVLTALCVWGGYAGMKPDRLRGTNPDVAAFAILLIVTPLFVLGCVQYSISGAKQVTVRFPSLRRFSISWWGDPLQCLMETTLFAGGTFLGNAIRLKNASDIGFWTCMVNLAVFLGLIIGQLIVYKLHRGRIIKEQ